MLQAGMSIRKAVLNCVTYKKVHSCESYEVRDFLATLGMTLVNVQARSDGALPGKLRYHQNTGATCSVYTGDSSARIG